MHRSLIFRLPTALTILVGVFGSLVPNRALACPDVAGIIDWNCDGRVEINAFGDSITFGTKDGRRLGYPGRLRRLAPELTVNNFGDPGERTSEGRQRAPIEFRRKRSADFVITLEGVNDYFSNSRSVPATRNNLRTIQEAGKKYGALSLLSELTQVNRSFQRPWVNGVNSAISPYTTIDFYSLGTRILSGDKLHPNDAGYDQMARYVLDRLRAISVRNRPADRDNDGIYDFAESRFHTNPQIADSDGDGVLDGAEVFRYRSNPLVTDTDGDGLTDGYEVNTLGSDPTSVLPTPPVIESLEALPR